MSEPSVYVCCALRRNVVPSNTRNLCSNSSLPRGEGVAYKPAFLYACRPRLVIAFAFVQGAKAVAVGCPPRVEC
jgi:hypothetical protein